VPFIEKCYSDIMLVRGAAQSCPWMPTGGLAVREISRKEHGDDHYEVVCQDLEKE